MTVKKEKRKKLHLCEDENLTQMAYRKIKEMMLNYDIIPGQRLVFVHLAKRLGVSPSIALPPSPL